MKNLILALLAFLGLAACAPGPKDNYLHELECTAYDRQLNSYKYNISYMHDLVNVRASFNEKTESVYHALVSPGYATRVIYITLNENSYLKIYTENDKEFQAVQVTTQSEGEIETKIELTQTCLSF